MARSPAAKDVLLLTLQKGVFNLYSGILYIESEDYSDIFSINIILSLITMFSVSVSSRVLSLAHPVLLRKALTLLQVCLLLSTYFLPPSAIRSHPLSMILNQSVIYLSRFIYDILLILYQSHPLFLGQVSSTGLQFGLGGVISTTFQLFVPFFSFTLRSSFDTNPFLLYSLLFVVYYLVCRAIDNRNLKHSAFSKHSMISNDPNLIVHRDSQPATAQNLLG